MRLQSPFSAITPTLDGDVLGALAGADEWFTISQLKTVVGSGSSDGIRKTLHRLVSEGVVNTMSAGRTGLYRLNREHMATPAILEIAGLRVAFISRLHDDMENWPDPPTYAAVFGSAARGEMRPDSDVDLILLKPDDAGDEWDARVASLAARASRWIGSDVQAVEFTVAESRNAGAREPVLLDVLSEGVTVFGSRSAFGRLVGGR